VPPLSAKLDAVSTVDRPLRRDAERNRRRILDAARELFAEQGLAVTLDDVADRAGLGVGTVYRRFSSRDQLIDALFEERVAEIVGFADEALALGDPWEGLTTFLDRLVALQAADRGLKEVLLGTTEGRERVGRIREQMRPRGQELIGRAQAAGVLRSDLSASDLPLLQMMLGAVAEVTTPEHGQLWRRFFVILLDGMRADGSQRSELPEPPLGFEQLDEVMCRWRPARRPPSH
jgi:AcrR family transcriptional regulator